MPIKHRFKRGDIVVIEKYWDQSDSSWRSGIVLIRDYRTPNDPACNAVYYLTCLQGNTTWITFNSDYFDKLEYMYWLGNIDESPALKVLYGTERRG